MAAKPSSYMKGETMRDLSTTARRRRVRRWDLALVWAVCGFFTITGGLTGVLLGAIILNWWSPGHPFFVAIKSTLESIF